MKGAAEPSLIHYKGKKDDWIVFIDDVDQYNEWKAAQQQADEAGDESVPDEDKDTTKNEKWDVPLFVTGKDEVFVTHKHGPQGTKDSASKTDVAAEFDSEDKTLAIKQILLKGNLVESKFPERQGPKNDSNGPMGAH